MSAFATRFFAHGVSTNMPSGKKLPLTSGNVGATRPACMPAIIPPHAMVSATTTNVAHANGRIGDGTDGGRDVDISSNAFHNSSA